MIPTIDETKQIIENTKHANIDIKETISKTVKAGWIDSNYYVLTLVVNGYLMFLKMKD